MPDSLGHLFPPDVAPAVSGFHCLGSDILIQGIDAALEMAHIRRNAGEPFVEAINSITAHLTKSLKGAAKDLFSKSVQEALHEAADLSELDLDALKTGIVKFLRKNGAEELTERLLCLYVYNSLWFRIQDEIRATGESMEDSFVDVAELCAETVSSVLRPWRTQKNPALLEPKLAGLFLSEIETNLTKQPIVLRTLAIFVM